MPHTVEERTPAVPVALDRLSTELSQEARAAEHGHAAVTLTPDQDGPFKQTVVALQAGAQLSPGSWNGPATIHVLVGSVSVSELDADVTPLHWTDVPTADATIEACENAVLLLTAASAGREANPEEGESPRTREVTIPTTSRGS